MVACRAAFQLPSWASRLLPVFLRTRSRMLSGNRQGQSGSFSCDFQMVGPPSPAPSDPPAPPSPVRLPAQPRPARPPALPREISGWSVSFPYICTTLDRPPTACSAFECFSIGPSDQSCLTSSAWLCFLNGGNILVWSMLSASDYSSDSNQWLAIPPHRFALPCSCLPPCYGCSRG